MQKKNDYYVNQHSCFLLQYHLVLVTKYRKPVFNDRYLNIHENIFLTDSLLYVK